MKDYKMSKMWTILVLMLKCLTLQTEGILNNKCQQSGGLFKESEPGVCTTKTLDDESCEPLPCQFPFKDPHTGQMVFHCVEQSKDFRMLDEETEEEFEDYDDVKSISRDKFCPIELDQRNRTPIRWGVCEERNKECPLLTYSSHPDIEKEMKFLLGRYPAHTRMFSVGQSVRGDQLWVLRMSEDLNAFLNGTKDDRNEDFKFRPRVKLIANMHGNEPVGREILIHFAQHLLKGHELGLSESVNVLRRMDLYIMPTMNPDGYGRSTEGSCSGGSYSSGRLNEKRKDLNRNFPDWWDWRDWKEDPSYDIYKNRQIETIHLMNWTLSDYFTLSMNFHDGAVLVNYPWDNYHENRQRFGSDFSPDEARGVHATPDHAEFYQLATSYSLLHPTMPNTTSICPAWGYFENGVTNGADWYPVKGGMQDFNYLFAGTFEVLSELSCCKFPSRKKLVREWLANKASLFNFVNQVHQGIQGFVRDESGSPIRDAKIQVRKPGETEWREFPVRSNENGIYHRILVPGEYEVQAFAEVGAKPVAVSEVRTVSIERNVRGGEKRRLDLVITGDRRLADLLRGQQQQSEVSVGSSNRPWKIPSTTSSAAVPPSENEAALLGVVKQISLEKTSSPSPSSPPTTLATKVNDEDEEEAFSFAGRMAFPTDNDDADRDDKERPSSSASTSRRRSGRRIVVVRKRPRINNPELDE